MPRHASFVCPLCTIGTLWYASLLLALPAAAQVANITTGPGTLNVFLDCGFCDGSYIREKAPFVNYVRDRTAADVHLLVTSERTGGGRRYVLDYIGRRDMAGLRDTLEVVTSNTDTDDERREALTRSIKLGLVRYVARTPVAADLDVFYSGGKTERPTMNPAEDPWNAWIFRIGANGDIESEESTDFLRLGGNFDARRVTENIKFRTSANGSFRRSRFELSDTTIVNKTNNGRVWAWLAKSFGEHWSVGGTSSASTSSFDNVNVAVELAPAVEYSIFPYSEFNRREFRIEYQLGLTALEYDELTVFDKTSERLVYHELQATMESREPWGSSEIDLEFYQYLHDFESPRSELYRVELRGEIDIRIVRGLSLDIDAGVSWVRDQISLPAEDISEEDILLRSRRLATDYEYGMGVGVTYTFGSIYNNVVNPRFGF